MRRNAQPELAGAAGLGPMTLVSHALCPYVQRAAIVAHEEAIALDRAVVDLADKPDWIVERSPTGKMPLLMIGDVTLFESAAIAEFPDEISGGGMLPRDPIERARHRAWIEFASGTLAEIDWSLPPPARNSSATSHPLRPRSDITPRSTTRPWPRNLKPQSLRRTPGRLNAGGTMRAPVLVACS